MLVVGAPAQKRRASPNVKTPSLKARHAYPAQNSLDASCSASQSTWNFAAASRTPPRNIAFQHHVLHHSALTSLFFTSHIDAATQHPLTCTGTHRALPPLSSRKSRCLRPSSCNPLYLRRFLVLRPHSAAAFPVNLLMPRSSPQSGNQCSIEGAEHRILQLRMPQGGSRVPGLRNASA